MGRIAEALKRAEKARAESQRVRSMTGSIGEIGQVRGLPEPATVRTATPPKPSEPPPPLSACDRAVVMLHDKASPIAEQFRSLRTWLLAHNTTGEHRILGVSSSLAREGRTVATANLGVALSEVRHLSTLVVDADVRNGELAGRFGWQKPPGLADVLAGRITLSEALKPTCAENLTVLPAGRFDRTTVSELINSAALPRMFDEIRERFHYVLVDTPPVQAAADVGRIGALCNGVLMVVRMHRTAAPVVRQSVRWLAANNVHVLGCIAVGADPRASSQSYQPDPN